MTEITVIRWIGSEEAEKIECSAGGVGGWFAYGHRWSDYEKAFFNKAHSHLRAIRASVLKNEIWQPGDWHQDHGIPLFSDGTVAQFTFRAWGDLMAAIWSTELDVHMCYLDFYYKSTPERPVGDRGRCEHCDLCFIMHGTKNPLGEPPAEEQAKEGP